MSQSLARRWKILCALLSLLSVVLAGLAYKLYKTTSLLYGRELEVRLEPFGDTVSLPSEAEILFVGDSRVEEWSTDELGMNVGKLGGPGQTSAQVIHRFQLLRDSKPKVVFIQVGINDLKAIPFVRLGRQKIVDDLITNLGIIRDQCEQMGAIAIVSTILPRGPLGLEDRLRWSDEIDEAVLETNEKIRKTFPNHFDAAAIISTEDDQRRISQGLMRDSLHLNKGGYALLNAKLKDRLTKELRDSATEPGSSGPSRR